MTAKEYLDQLNYVNDYIDALLVQKAKAFVEATHITPMYGGDVRVQTSDRNAQEEKMLKVCEYDLMIDREIDRFIDLKQEAMGIIQRMGCQLQKTILIQRHFNGLTMENIADKMGYERTTIFRQYSEALKNFEEKMQHFATLCNCQK